MCMELVGTTTAARLFWLRRRRVCFDFDGGDRSQSNGQGRDGGGRAPLESLMSRSSLGCVPVVGARLNLFARWCCWQLTTTHTTRCRYVRKKPVIVGRWRRTEC